jgi:hypothetical protein
MRLTTEGTEEITEKKLIVNGLYFCCTGASPVSSFKGARARRPCYERRASIGIRHSEVGIAL